MSTVILGILLLILGIGGNIWVSRRVFYRRNAAGVEIFANYSQSIATRLQEKIVLLIAGLCILGGITCLIVSCMGGMATTP